MRTIVVSHALLIARSVLMGLLVLDVEMEQSVIIIFVTVSALITPILLAATAKPVELNA